MADYLEFEGGVYSNDTNNSYSQDFVQILAANL